MLTRWMPAVLLCVTASATACSPQTTISDRTPAPSAAPTPRSTPLATRAPSPGPCRYVFPVQPPSAARYGASHHDYPATDIFAQRGSGVVSPTDGVVDWVSREDPYDPRTDDPATRGGRSVAIIGDDGIRYYGSHLQDVGAGIEAGVRVEAGAPVGRLGDSGNAEGTGPHLHFGISRPTTPDDWQVRRGEVSPYLYLNEWKAGRALTPEVPGARPARCVVRRG